MVNGAERESEPIRLDQFLRSLGADARAVAVERNGLIVPRRLYGEVSLGDGDRLEIVRITGGG
ncbi:MAG: sulfur carrier protein ThiS [Candidatus Dormibacteria bacterium]